MTGARAGQGCAAAMLGLLLLACAGAAGAQVYKWTDANGTVHYGDTPPPQQAATRLKAGSQAAAASGPNLPYELSRAAQLHPVTLYTTPDCAPCEQGRQLLRARGIPYAEKTVVSDGDKEALRQRTGSGSGGGGGTELPLLEVGKRRIAGFQDAAWQEALNSASYPKQTQLPPGYQYAAPEPVAPASVPGAPVRAKIKVPPDAAAAQAAEQAPRREPARPAPTQ